MKYLSDYTENGISEALEKFGGFFAFSDKQFNEAKKEGVKYTQIGHCLICPVENAIALSKAIIEVHDRAVQQDLQENGKDAIIERELYNYEAFYTGEIDDTVDAVKVYGFTHDDVLLVYRNIRNRNNH